MLGLTLGLTLGPGWFALGLQGFLDTNMLVLAMQMARVLGHTQCKAQTGMVEYRLKPFFYLYRTGFSDFSFQGNVPHLSFTIQDIMVS